jgi:predicted TIM-barrel fold metal-dependent hydrolase
MGATPFVDAHMHLWDLARDRYAWLSAPFSDSGPNGNVASIAETYLVEDYRAEAARWNVVGAVHVEAGAANSLAETDWLQHVAEGAGLPSGLVAFAALDDPNLESLLRAHAAHSKVRGIRHIVNWHADPNRTYTVRDITGDEAWRRGFALLSKYKLSFDLQAYPAQFAGLAPLIAAYPETSVIINHAGMGVDGVGEWRTAMRLLAALPNVSVKASGLGFVCKPWDQRQARARALETIDIFGVDRVMLASDFPTDRLFASFDRVMEVFADATADFSDGERRALFARNANRIYRLGLSV